MEPVLEREEATTSSQLVGILPGEPPRVNLVDFASGRNGLKRHFAQQVAVLDPDLFARLQAEAGVGDYIRATVVNEYRETGSRVYLADFQRTSDTSTAGAKNGTHAVSPSLIVVAAPAPQPKTKTKSKTSVGK